MTGSRATDGGDRAVLEGERLALEREQFEFNKGIESQRLELEGRRVAAEPRNRFIGALGASVPLLVGLLALAGTLLSTRQSLESDFQLKVAELAISGAEGPSTIRLRARALRDLYPDRLPADFADRLAGGQYFFGSADEFRWQFLQQAVAHARCPDQVIGLWRQVFGPEQQPDEGDLEWVATLSVAACPPQASQPTVPTSP